MWAIYADHLWQPSDKLSFLRAGKRSPDFDDGKWREAIRGRTPTKLRLYDDNNVLYYEAVCISHNDEDLSLLFEWAMADSGVTYMMYQDFRGHWRYLYG